MIWGFIKLCFFTCVAVVTGLLCATGPIGGRTIASRAQELWAQPEVKRQVGQLEGRVRRGVDAAVRDDDAPVRATRERSPAPDAAPPPTSTRVDPHAVAKVVADTPPGDAFRPSERQAVQHLIQQRARHAHPAH